MITHLKSCQNGDIVRYAFTLLDYIHLVMQCACTCMSFNSHVLYDVFNLFAIKLLQLCVLDCWVS